MGVGGWDSRVVLTILPVEQKGFWSRQLGSGDTCLLHRPHPAPPSEEGSAKNAEGTSMGCDFLISVLAEIISSEFYLVLLKLILM